MCKPHVVHALEIEKMSGKIFALHSQIRPKLDFGMRPIVQRKMTVGKNLGKFDKFEAIRQTFTHPKLNS